MVESMNGWMNGERGWRGEWLWEWEIGSLVAGYVPCMEQIFAENQLIALIESLRSLKAIIFNHYSA